MTNHTLAILRARVKLYTRHLSEWADLAANQRLVWTIAHDEFAQQRSLCGTDKTAQFRMKANQAERFSKLLANQGEKRAQLKQRQRYEFVLLEQLGESPDGID